MLGTRIKMAMEKRGLSAAELAELTNLSKETVDRAIEGKAELKLWAVENIAANLGVTKEWLAFGEDAKPIKIRIKYHADIEHMEKIAIGDWIDLRAAEDVDLKMGDYYYISLGVSMELPEGYEAHVAPRSSTMKQFGILCGNSFGIIDNSFRGDGDVWKFAAYAIRDTSIKKGDRICQFRIEKNQPGIEFVEVGYLGNADRGGYGSTGRR